MNLGEFQINHYDYFTYRNSKPNEKAWSFNLNIENVSPNIYKATYSKVLTECLYLLNTFRKENIKFDLLPIGFTYKIDQNTLSVVDKKDVVNQLKMLIEMNHHTDKNIQKELENELAFYIEYEDTLDKYLLRELELLHEFDNSQIPIDELKTIDKNISDLKETIAYISDDGKEIEEEIHYTTGEFNIVKTHLINEALFKFDNLRGISVLASSIRHCANLHSIINDFYAKDIQISDYDHITLNREQRQLTIKNCFTHYLLKERMTKSDDMKKISIVEIKKLN
jgi:hypothetical protein